MASTRGSLSPAFAISGEVGCAVTLATGAFVSKDSVEFVLTGLYDLFDFDTMLL